MMPVEYAVSERIATITLNRPEAMNSLDPESLVELNDAFQRANADQDVRVVILTGAGDKAFCTGSDLKKTMPPKESFAELTFGRPKWLYPFAGMEIDKPMICAVNGYALAGGMELALWADMRVVAEDATFGIFCRRFGVPLIDLGTIRLPRLIGHSQAIDLILTGRPVGGAEALRMGLANRLVPKGETRAHAIALAKEIARFPQACLRADRLSALRQWDLSEEEAIAGEMRGGLEVIASGETLSGATRFASGAGRHGTFGGDGK